MINIFFYPRAIISRDGLQQLGLVCLTMQMQVISLHLAKETHDHVFEVWAQNRGCLVVSSAKDFTSQSSNGRYFWF